MEMNDKKRIKKYIGKRWSDVFGWVMLAITVICALLGMLLDTHMIGRSLDVPVEVTPETKRGYVYLDIYAISKQVYYWHEETAKDYYYLANDEEGNFYFVMFNEPMEGLLKQQRVYWDDYTDAKKPKEPYRVCGTVRNVSNDAFDALIEDTGYEAEMLEEIISNGGKKGIEVDLTASRNLASKLELSAICLITFSLIWIFSGTRRRKLTRLTLKRLKELDLTEKAAQELEAAGKSKTPVLLTKNFVFVRRSGAVFPYDDIAFLFNSATSIVIHTKTLSNCQLLNTMNMRPQLEALVAEISKRAPYALVGCTVENMTKYKTEYPNAKQL